MPSLHADVPATLVPATGGAECQSPACIRQLVCHASGIDCTGLSTTFVSDISPDDETTRVSNAGWSDSVVSHVGLHQDGKLTPALVAASHFSVPSATEASIPYCISVLAPLRCADKWPNAIHGYTGDHVFATDIATFDPASPFTLPRGASKARPKSLASSAPGIAVSSAAQASQISHQAEATSTSSVAAEVPALEHPLLQGSLPCPFASFDEIQGNRVLNGEADWPNWRYIQAALDTSDLPGVPTGRILISEIVGFPSPQVAITQDRGPDPRRALVVEATTVGGSLETIDAVPGVTPVRILHGLHSIRYSAALEEWLQAGHLLCLVNYQLVSAYTAIPADADVMHFMHAVPPASAQPAAAIVSQLDTGADRANLVPTVVREYGPRPDAPPLPPAALAMQDVRPPTPPIPHEGPPPRSASAQIVQRYRPGRTCTRPFTTFDAHYGHRTFYCHGFATHPERLQLVLAASPALGLSPRYQWLDVEVEGLPSPQLVLQQAHIPHHHWTFPLDLRACGGQICVLIAERRCSPLEFVARATDTCRLHGRVTCMLADGDLALRVDGHMVAHDAPTAFRFASIASLSRTQLWGRHSIFRRHGAVACMLPEHHRPSARSASSNSDDAVAHSGPAGDTIFYPLDGDRFPPDEDFTVVLHTAGIQPIIITAPCTASHDDVCQLATRCVLPLLPHVARDRCRWRPCSTTPVGEHLLHSVFVIGTPEAQCESHVVLDLRGLGGDPAFHTVIFPVMLSTELLFRLLTNFLGGRRPTTVFRGAVPITGYLCSLSTGDMLRPVCSDPTLDSTAAASPAVWRTITSVPCQDCVQTS